MLQVVSLQQHNSKLEQQLKRQQQQLTHAEQTIMGLTSSKVLTPSTPAVAAVVQSSVLPFCSLFCCAAAQA